MHKSKNLIQYLPTVLQNKKEYIQICNTQDTEFNLAYSSLNTIYRNKFLSDLDLYGVKRWEKIMKITPRDSDTLDDRRFRVMNRYLNKLPYTMRSLKNVLNTLCGEKGYKVNFNPKTFVLSVKLELTVKNQLDEVKRTLRSFVPANVIVDISLLYNQHLTISKYSHEYLSTFTHEQIRSDEKLANINVHDKPTQVNPNPVISNPTVPSKPICDWSIEPISDIEGIEYWNALDVKLSKSINVVKFERCKKVEGPKFEEWQNINDIGDSKQDLFAWIEGASPSIIHKVRVTDEAGNIVESNEFKCTLIKK